MNKEEVLVGNRAHSEPFELFETFEKDEKPDSNAEQVSTKVITIGYVNTFTCICTGLAKPLNNSKMPKSLIAIHDVNVM